MKRESKAYSFKEQQEEKQLRKELEEKRKKAGVNKAPELSDKQKEVMRVELEKEGAIRTTLSKVSVIFAFDSLFLDHSRHWFTFSTDERTVERNYIAHTWGGYRKRSFVVSKISFSVAVDIEEFAIAPSGETAPRSVHRTPQMRRLEK